MIGPKSYLALFALCLCFAQVSCGNFFETLSNILDQDEWDATYARNLRSECRVQFAKANEAQNQMFKMENEDDVNGYEKWLASMRHHDKKLAECSAKYEQVRDYLESMIWKGELIINGFDMHYEKSTKDSILDHITGRAKL